MLHLSGIASVYTMDHEPRGLTLRTVDYVIICALGPMYSFNLSFNLVLEM